MSVVRVATRHGLAWMAVTGLASATALLSSVAAPGPAEAAAPTHHLNPLPGEWWFPAWQVQSKVWPLTSGKGVIVAVLDSGVQANVPDLRGAVIPGGDTTGAGTNGMTDDDYANNGHGTALASVIAGQGRGTGMVGIAPGAKILPVRVGGMNGVPGDGNDITEAKGIRFAVNHGAQVINMSFAGVSTSASNCDPLFEQAVAYALRHNVVMIAGAGNTGNTGNMAQQPASCPGVLAVGGVNPDLTLWPGSQRQPYVRVTAPGNYVGWSGRNGKYLPHGAGTSFSCAFVSGAAALIRSRYPHMPWQQVVARIIHTARPEGRPIPNDRYGYGIVRLDRAVNASRYPVPASAPNPVYASFQRWLRSPLGRAFTSPQPTTNPTPAVAASHPAGGSSLLSTLIAAVVAALVAAIAIPVTVARRRRRRARGTSADAGPRAPPPPWATPRKSKRS